MVSEFAGASPTNLIAGQPLLASLEKLLRPPVIQVLDNPLAPAELSDAVLAAKPSSTMRILSSVEKCRRVVRRISLTTRSAGSLTANGFLSHLRSPKGYDEQKSSLPQSLDFVP